MKRLAIFALLVPATIWPQQGEPPDSSEIVDELLAYANSAPAGFAADAMIRIAVSKLEIPDEDRIEILKTAFRTGSRAEEPTPITVYRTQGDRETLIASIADGQGIDVVSTQARALEAILELSPSDAAELARDIALPEIGPGECSIAWAPNVTPYYDALAKITPKNTGLDADEIAQLIGRKLGPIRSFAQVQPAASLIANIALPDEERLSLVRTFAASLTQDLAADPRPGPHVALYGARHAAADRQPPRRPQLARCRHAGVGLQGCDPADFRTRAVLGYPIRPE